MTPSLLGRRAWVIKGQPTRNHFATTLRRGAWDRWFTKRPPRAWSRGDALFFWESAPALRVVGIGEIAGFGSEGDRSVFLVRYLTDPLEQPLGLAEVRGNPVLASASFTRAGAAGTVFPLTEGQADQLMQMIAVANPNLPVPVFGEHEGVEWPTRALSVRQPWAELILRGEKTIEVRTIPTNIRGRVAVYASLGRATAAEEHDVTATFRIDVDGLPRGVLVGAVDIVGCARLTPADARAAVVPLEAGCTDYGWRLERPVRLFPAMPPANHPQPVFFRPFAE